MSAATRPLTSLYADTWRALYRLLCEAPWPGPPVDAPGMRVFLGGFGKNDEPLEAAMVVLDTINSAQDWAALGRRSRDEEFATRVEVGTRLRNRTASETLDRLEELSAVVEQTITLTADTSSQPAEVAGRMVWWQVAQIEPVVGPLADGGFGGFARITIAVKARIGGLP